MEGKPAAAGSPTQELATRIYVEFITRNTQFEGGNPKLAADPTKLALVSVKLASAFFDAEKAAAEQALETKKADKVAGPDVGSWLK